MLQSMSLRLEPYAWDPPGIEMSREHPIAFKVLGLPPGQVACIAHFKGLGWRLLRHRNDRRETWRDGYANIGTALAALYTRLALGL
jgi:hypothetical protein